MIQLAMLFALGVLVASLVALAILPLVSRRAERRARVRLARQMPMSLPEIAAERDEMRAAHAIEVRRLEQRIEGLNPRLAALLSENGRQSSRLATLERQRELDIDTIRALEAAVGQARQSLLHSEAERGAQALALHDAYAIAERRRDLLEAATMKLSVAEILSEDQRTVIGELEKSNAARSFRPSVEAVPSARSTDDAVQLRASFGRLRSEHDLLRKTHEVVAAEREKLWFRVDELLLRIDDLQDQAEEAHDGADADRRRVAQRDKTIATLTTRVAAREEALGTVKLLLAEETARRKAIEAGRPDPSARGPDSALDPALRDDPAALRRAIASLAADLVRVATVERDLDERLPSAGAG